MPSPKPDTRGYATSARYGAAYIAARAREGKVTKALAEAGLDPAKMKPEDYEAFRRQVFAKSAAHAREVLARKRAVARAERNAAAALQALEEAKAAFAADGAA